MARARNTAPPARGLSARSVLLSVLLGTDPPRLPVQLLVRTTELFGIAEGATRTALSRMRDRGELVAEDGWYALASDRLLARQARQTASRQARTRAWLGSRWLQAVVVPNSRRSAAVRNARRAALAAARLSELREGVWLRPDNLGDPPAIEGDDVQWMRSVPDGDPRRLASRLWDLDAWAGRSDGLQLRMNHLLAPLEAGDRRVVAEGFVLSADVLRHLQADPLLPAELLPEGWPGGSLRQQYDQYDAAYRAVLRDWFAQHS